MIRSGIDLASSRKRLELSQTQLAEQIGVSQATISRLEQGEHTPSFQLLVKIARALELNVRDIVDEETLRDALGQETVQTFYAFCPNPTCSRNEIGKRQGDSLYVTWRSGEEYQASRYNEVNFCTRCGTDLAKECPSCGRFLEGKDTRYCISCGTAITLRPTEEDWKQIRILLGLDAAADDDDIPF